MLDLLSFLVSPLRWWRVRHPTLTMLNYVFPTIFSVVSFFAIARLPVKMNLFGEFGLVHQSNGLMQILAGFYIASLAAIATFARGDLDKPMLGNPPKLSRGEGRSAEELTRRRLLCMLFGYLAFSAIILYLVGAAFMMLAPLLRDAVEVGSSAHVYLRATCSAIFVFFVVHTLASTVMGIYYMAVRLHEPELQLGFYHQPEATYTPDPPNTQT